MAKVSAAHDLPTARLATVVCTALAIHLAAWVLLPALLEGSIRLDVAEHAIQGREWLLAYPKHPPFTVWLVALARALGPARYIVVFFFAQALALAGLAAAAFLLWRHKGPAAAALTILIGLPTPFLTYVPIQLNHNIGLLPFWGMALVAGFAAFERGRVTDWLIFGAAVGFGVWAKYSILHLAVPLALAFLAVPEWRAKLATPGPWLAAAMAALIAAPQAIAVLQGEGAAFDYALRTQSDGIFGNLRRFFDFLVNAALLLAFMALVVGAAAGGLIPLRKAIAQSFSRARKDRLALYLHVALFGPIALIAIAALMFGVRPRILWLTPIVLSAAVWWANIAIPARGRVPRPALNTAGALGLLFASSYLVVSLAAPYLRQSPSYSDFDGPALARLAERHWRSNAAGPIPYIVSFPRMQGRQAAGSILFDSADRPHVFEDADPRLSPWIDIADLARRGALVVSTVPLGPDRKFAGFSIANIVQVERPTTRGGFRVPRSIYFAIVRPAN